MKLPNPLKSIRTRLAKSRRRRLREDLQILLSLVDERSQPNMNTLLNLIRNHDVLALNVKAFGYDLARSLGQALPLPSEGPASFVGLKSKPSTQTDLESDWVSHWCRELAIPVCYHRKVWELAFVLQALHEAGHLHEGAKGLGFGCGNEPFPSYFASRGIATLATDLSIDDARASGWVASNQHAASLEKAFHSHLVDRDAFDRNVRFRELDMNEIDDDLRDYDFCWSMCAFEHLGSIEQGLRFVENAMRTLRPGGTAVHTTELNINPDGPTVDNWPTVLFQRKHFEDLAERLRAQGHHVADLDFDTGSKPLDRFIDLPPWSDGTLEQLSVGLGQPYHLKLSIDGFVSTCFGLIVTKRSDGPG